MAAIPNPDPERRKVWPWWCDTCKTEFEEERFAKECTHGIPETNQVLVHGTIDTRTAFGDYEVLVFDKFGDKRRISFFPHQVVVLGRCGTCSATDNRKTVRICADCIRATSLEARRLERLKLSIQPHVPAALVAHYNDCDTCWWNPDTGYMEMCRAGEALWRAEVPSGPLPQTDAVGTRRSLEERTTDVAPTRDSSSTERVKGSPLYEKVYESLETFARDLNGGEYRHFIDHTMKPLVLGTIHRFEQDNYIPPPSSFIVTHDLEDAPDGAEVLIRYKRVGMAWEQIAVEG